MNVSPEFEAFADRGRNASVVDVFQRRYADRCTVRRSSEGLTGGCPVCGDDGKRDADRFSINAKKNVWLCRVCGKGGDAIELVRHVEGCSFSEAVTAITGEDPPGRDTGPAREIADDPVARERREERRAQEAAADAAESARKSKVLSDVQALWTAAAGFAGSKAQRYLKARGIDLAPAQYGDLRFVADLEYRGYPGPGAEAEEPLGQFPAMIAAIRNVEGALIGVHRTYLARDAAEKLTPPGDLKRNAAKKVFGQQKGGHIRLGPISSCMAIGEGIETTCSWYQLGIGPDDVGIMAGINLGNISGRSLGSVPHPTIPKRTVPDGNPDLREPGLILPPTVHHVILLGDGDSEPVWTRMRILTAARRFRAEGREVSICWPNGKEDFNDVARRAAA